MVSQRVIDFTSITGTCGDLSALFESIAEKMSSGDELLIKAREDQLAEIRDSIMLLENYFEIVEEKKVGDVYEIRVKRK